MPEETTTQAVTTETPAPAATTETSPAEESQARESVSLETHRKVQNEAKNLRERLKAFEQAEEARKQAEMSEIDRLKAQFADMEKKAKTLEVQSVRTRAAAKFSIPEELQEFLTAEDEAGALAQAEKLAAKLKPAGDLPPSGNRNPANPTEGAQKAAEEEQFKALRSVIPALNFRTLRS
jgi:hypothetical protein